MNMEKQLKDYLDERLVADGGEAVAVDESLLDSGVLDSTAVFELIDFIESTFGIKIPDEEIVPEHFDTIQAIAAFIGTKSGT